MKKNIWLISLILIVLFTASLGLTQDEPIRVDFSGDTAEENQISLMGAGFGEYPQADDLPESQGNRNRNENWLSHL